MLNAYSRRKDGNALLSRSFRVREFACRDGSDPLFVDSALVQLLQSIRDHFGAPVVITSGYRTAAHNRAVGGAPYSQHCYGRAPDIRVAGVPVEQLDLHLFRQDVLNVDADSLPGGQVGTALRKAGQIGCDLNEGAVFLHAAHDAHHGLAHGEPGGVFFPGAQQFPDGQHKAALQVPALDGA